MAEKEEKPEKEKEKGREKEQRREESIVRMSGRDINGNFKISTALMQIKGIGYNLAHSLSLSAERMYGINTDTKIGTLSEEQLTSIENLIKDPKKANIPDYLFNRRKDSEVGSNIHVVGTDLIVKTRQDIDNDVKSQTWRGFRHRYGQKVRGQRTRSTGRTGATVGVTKKAIQEQQKAAIAGERGGGGAAPGAAAGTGGAAAPAKKPEAPAEPKK